MDGFPVLYESMSACGRNISTPHNLELTAMYPLQSFIQSRSVFVHTLHHYDAVLEEWIGDYDSIENYPVEEKIAQLIRHKPLRVLQIFILAYGLLMTFVGAKSSSSVTSEVRRYWSWVNSGLVAFISVGLIDIICFFLEYSKSNRGSDSDTMKTTSSDHEKIVSIIGSLQRIVTLWPSPQILFSLLALTVFMPDNKLKALSSLLISYYPHIWCIVLLLLSSTIPNITRMVGLSIGLLKVSVVPIHKKQQSETEILSNKKGVPNKWQRMPGTQDDLVSKENQYGVPIKCPASETKSDKVSQIRRPVFRYHTLLRYFNESKILQAFLLGLELRIIIPELMQLIEKAKHINVPLLVLKCMVMLNYLMFKFHSIVMH